MEEIELEPLYQIIEKILHYVSEDQERARHPEIKSKYESSEGHVEVQIVGPILTALGWDIVNPNHVSVKHWEFSPDKPDFVLLSKERPIIVIEAKALGKIAGVDNLKQIEKYLRYCPNVILTDGIEWHFYSARHMNYTPLGNHVEEELWDKHFKEEIIPRFNPIWKFNLLNHNRHFCVALLTGIHRIEHGGFKEYEENIFQTWSQAESTIYLGIDGILEKSIKHLQITGIVTKSIFPKVAEHIKKELRHELSLEEFSRYIEDHLEESFLTYIYYNIKGEFEEDYYDLPP